LPGEASGRPPHTIPTPNPGQVSDPLPGEASGRLPDKAPGRVIGEIPGHVARSRPVPAPPPPPSPKVTPLPAGPAPAARGAVPRPPATSAPREAGRGAEPYWHPVVERVWTSPAPVGQSVDPVAAAEFLRLYHSEEDRTGDLTGRLREVRAEIDRTGSYTHTTEELAFGARVAWRNAARCIGRLYWRSLVVRDRRGVREPQEGANPAARP